MSTLTARARWRHCLAGLLALFAGTAQAAAPQISTITGNPLTIRVGDDASFQILNSEVPGIGQIYPSNSEGTADLGWFVRVGTTLYAPRFDEHPDGSATSQLGDFTPFTPVSISAITGTGTSQNPFRTTVVNDLGTSGLRATLQVSYITGSNYLTQTWTLRNTAAAAQNVRVFYAGDIYLAADDSGIPHLATNSGSPGGKNCPGADRDYYVLLIPQTPADAYSATGYSNIWGQIGEGQLDKVVTTECIDNGAALQWNRNIAANASTVIQAATSFGNVPAIAQFNVTEVTPNSGQAGQTVNVTITGIGFIAASTFDFGPDITLGNLTIVNATTATATLTIAPTAATGPRDVGGREHNEGVSATLGNGFTVLAPGAQPPGTLQFGATSYSVNEGAGTLTVSVTRINGSSGAASIQYGSTDGSATTGADYTAATGTLQWAAGDTAAKTFTIAITDDLLQESNETFTLTLSNATGATAGTPTTVTVTIIDNDSPTVPGSDGKMTSGGAFGSVLLAVFAAGAALRRRLRSLLPLAAIAAALGLPGIASADTGDWYLGLRAGVAQASHDSAQLTRELRRRGNAVTADVDDKDFGGVLYAGYRVHSHAAVELGYLRLGRYDTRLSGDLSQPQALLDDSAEVFQGNGNALLLALRFDLPLYGPVSFTPRLGGYWWTSETELNTAAGTLDQRKDSAGLEVGLGFAVALGSQLKLGLNSELLRGSNHGSQGLHTLQIEYGF